ncbi:MAG: SurA N-terminal domain-containing protein, partial [Bdellovibrionales bacterium]
MRNLFSALTVCALLLGAGPVLAQRIDQLPAARQMPFMETPQAQEAQDLSEGIVAVVNDSIISTSDMQDRISLAALSAGLPDRPDVRKKLFPQVLRSLIDEQIQLQEGKKEGISISPEEIDQAMKRLAADNK